MLEKNKDYLEMRVSSTDCAFVQNAPTQISVDGYVYTTYMDIPDPGELYVFISKEKFEKLQTENKDLCERLKYSKMKEVERAKLLYNHHPWCYRNVPIEEYLTKRGFTCVTEAIDNLDATVKSYRDMFDGCEPAYVKQRIDEMKDTIKSYTDQISEWREATGCPSPSVAKTLIESGASWHHAYNESKKANEKRADTIKSWQNVTGYSIPEDFLSAKINKVVKEVSSWEEITGFSTPEKCSSYIDTLEKKLEDIKDLIEED